jgi:hypothetical protein
MGKLAEVGESAKIVDVVYKYIELVDGKSSKGGVSVEMVFAAEQPAGEIETKKSMLRTHPIVPISMLKVMNQQLACEACSIWSPFTGTHHCST